MFKINSKAALLLGTTLSLSLMFSGCQTNNNSSSKLGDLTTSSNADAKYSVVCTIFPEYDWVREILGDYSDKFDLTLLLNNGTDLHSYQPSAEDIMKISSCDLFVYVGGESDAWVEDALSEAVNKDMKVINLMDVLGDDTKEEETVEGMQHEHEHDHADEADHDDADHEDSETHDHTDDADHEDAEDADHEDSETHEDADHEAADEHDHEDAELEYDEHVWLSIKDTEIFVEEISNALMEIDTENKDNFKANEEAYISKLQELDSKYEEAVSSSENKTLLFADRFPFRYMVDDYDLDYYAAFSGCSAETEASFETITFLAEKVNELGLTSVIILENSEDKIANTIIENTESKSQEILTLDSLQSTTSEEIEGGKTYLSAMEGNLEVIEKALS
ncbi:MAG: metal ABC transporter substrate-binding protein [Lachnospiraceae bacterium]|nr:metal ABC transporter substrate-binding protein [Lachnospiraceae bacterium]